MPFRRIREKETNASEETKKTLRLPGNGILEEEQRHGHRAHRPLPTDRGREVARVCECGVCECGVCVGTPEAAEVWGALYRQSRPGGPRVAGNFRCRGCFVVGTRSGGGGVLRAVSLLRKTNSNATSDMRAGVRNRDRRRASWLYTFHEHKCFFDEFKQKWPFWPFPAKRGLLSVTWGNSGKSSALMTKLFPSYTHVHV